MPTEPVTLERQQSIGILSLNRPEVHNVVDDAVMERLESLLDRVEADPELRVLILTGAGSETFSAGGDLGYFATLETRDEGFEMSRRMQAILGRLAAGSRPVIAAVNGNAWGGGCEILTACHLRVASGEARFGFRQAAMGLITGWGGGVRLFRLIGRSNALRLLLTAQTIDAEEALRVGLVDQVVEPGEVMPEAIALARQIAANAGHSIRAFLDLARAAERDAEEALTEAETRLFSDCWEGDHFRLKVAEWEEQRTRRKIRN